MPRERATANRGTILTTTMRSAGWHVGAAHVADGTVVATGCPSAGADLCSARASAPGPSRSRRIIRPRLASYYSTRVRGALYRCRGNACLQCPSNERMACGIDVSGPASSGWVKESHARSAALILSSRVGMKQTFRRWGAFWDRFVIIPTGRSIAVSPASVVSTE